VRENLELGAAPLPGGVVGKLERALEMFPFLRGRLQHLAGTLSGGERQMMAMARAWMGSPRLLFLDEPSLGLTHRLVHATFEQVQHLSRSTGAAVLIVEQKVREVLKIADRVCVLSRGGITFTGACRDLDDERLRSLLL